MLINYLVYLVHFGNMNGLRLDLQTLNKFVKIQQILQKINIVMMKKCTYIEKVSKIKQECIKSLESSSSEI